MFKCIKMGKRVVYKDYIFLSVFQKGAAFIQTIL